MNLRKLDKNLREMPKVKVNLVYLIGLFLLTIIGVHFYSSRNCSTNDKHQSSLSKQRFRLVVLVLSAPDNIERRDRIRKSWFSEKQSELRSLFAIGTLSLSSEQRFNIDSESQRHDDLLLLPKLHDSYGTVTKKVLQSIVYLYKNYDFDFLLKCDDDTFVLLDRLLRDLNRWQNKGSKKELYWGYFNGRARVKRSGPWKETDWFLCDYYLPYALGGGYVLSYNLVKFIAENSEILKLHNSEDVSVGLWLASIANIERRHDTRFDTEYRSRGCSNQYLVTHKQSAEDMIKLYEYFKKTGNLCAQEVNNYLGYQYNWTVPPSQCCNRRPGIP